jgi:hypothetical protein
MKEEKKEAMEAGEKTEIRSRETATRTRKMTTVMMATMTTDHDDDGDGGGDGGGGGGGGSGSGGRGGAVMVGWRERDSGRVKKVRSDGRRQEESEADF